jgi:hypothetical protein
MPNATVNIWWFADWMLPQQTGAGHASLSLDDPQTGADVYITWLGGEMHDEVVQGTRTLADDCQHFGWNHEEIKIPLRDAQHQVGLDAAAICAWWARRRTQQPAYHLVSPENNCDGTVVQALIAGGGEHFVRCPMTLTYYRGARTLRTWANDLKEEITRLRGSPLATAKVALSEGGGWVPANHVMPPEEWKRVSNAGKFAVRKEQVAAIDKLLAQYQQQLVGVDGDDAGVNQARSLLMQILTLALDHLKHKPHSARRPAVLTLGRQVYDAVQRLP